MVLEICFKRLSPTAVKPERKSEGAAGYDLFAARECVVPPRGKALVPTDLSIVIPKGYYGKIEARSGLAWKSHIDVGAGVIDSDYRGAVGIVLFNHSETECKIPLGFAAAQIVFLKVEQPFFVEKEELDDTVRGAGGFGSTSETGSGGAGTPGEERKEKPIEERKTPDT